jgi:hypothetical protein
MSKPAEILLFDFLADAIGVAQAGSVLFDLELHDTVYQRITKGRGVRISESTGDFSHIGTGEIREYDVEVIVTCYSLVSGKAKQERQPALVDVFEIQKAIYTLIAGDYSLGSRVCDSLLRPGSRGYDVFEEGVYAVSNTPLIINPSGARYAD